MNSTLTLSPQPALSDGEFRQFQGLIHRLAGIHMPPAKKALVAGRLAKRLRERALASFGAYYRLITQDGDEQELQRAVNLLTTNETYFFREPAHFEFLAQRILPEWRGERSLRAWSAASSSGEEAYSIAMVLMHGLGDAAKWEVFGSDLSTDVLARARAAVYAQTRSDGIPPEFRQRYCLRGVRSQEGRFQIDGALRARTRFASVNLTRDIKGVGEFDIIFLRNVLIYFDIETKRAVVERVARQLRPGGWLFIGHSESLNGLNTGLLLERPTIYRKPAQ